MPPLRRECCGAPGTRWVRCSTRNKDSTRGRQFPAERPAAPIGWAARMSSRARGSGRGNTRAAGSCGRRRWRPTCAVCRSESDQHDRRERGAHGGRVEARPGWDPSTTATTPGAVKGRDLIGLRSGDGRTRALASRLRRVKSRSEKDDVEVRWRSGTRAPPPWWVPGERRHPGAGPSPPRPDSIRKSLIFALESNPSPRGRSRAARRASRRLQGGSSYSSRPGRKWCS